MSNLLILNNSNPLTSLHILYSPSKSSAPFSALSCPSEEHTAAVRVCVRVRPDSTDSSIYQAFPMMVQSLCSLQFLSLHFHSPALEHKPIWVVTLSDWLTFIWIILGRFVWPLFEISFLFICSLGWLSRYMNEYRTNECVG